MVIILEKDNILKCADSLLSERIGSLKNDMERCIQMNMNRNIVSKDKSTGDAPFPILLYCFSIIDMLGSLYCGWASNKKKLCDIECDYKSKRQINECGGITCRSRKYMNDFMDYGINESKMIQKIFRHKLVHLSQPSPIVIKDGKNITWKIHHSEIEKHLNPDLLKNGTFNISIIDLVNDIEKSTKKYLISLKKDNNLQQQCEKALSQIYEPLKI